jgi:hypothetical protein
MEKFEPLERVQENEPSSDSETMRQRPALINIFDFFLLITETPPPPYAMKIEGEFITHFIATPN